MDITTSLWPGLVSIAAIAAAITANISLSKVRFLSMTCLHLRITAVCSRVFSRPVFPFPYKHLKSADEPWPCCRRVYYIVHIPPGCSYIRIGEFAPVLLYFLLPAGNGSLLLLFLLNIMFAAPSGPMTAISALGRRTRCLLRGACCSSLYKLRRMLS